eukprot:Clim_evm45s157 gene=Clim_evmTU45s157
MTEYSKYKVDELRALLSDRDLPTAGKKAELIARLEEADANAASTEPESKTAPATDKKKAATPAKSPEKTAAATKSTPAKTPGGAASATLGGPADENADSEVERLRARAKRFGMDALGDQEKARLRAARFGIAPPSAEKPKKGTPGKGAQTPQQKKDPLSNVDPATAERMRKRMERFGSTENSPAPKQAKIR